MTEQERMYGKKIKEDDKYIYYQYDPMAQLVKRNEYDYWVKYRHSGCSQINMEQHFFLEEDAKNFMEKLPYFKVDKNYKRECIQYEERIIYADSTEGSYLKAAGLGN